MEDACCTTLATDAEALASYRRDFARDGYLLFEGVVARRALAALARDIVQQWRADCAAGSVFGGGGTLSRHLNCFPGTGSRFAFDALRSSGAFDIVAALSSRPLRVPHVGCNLNLPGSSAQNPHVDGYVAAPFLIANVAGIDTDTRNGALEIVSGTHEREHKY